MPNIEHTEDRATTVATGHVRRPRRATGLVALALTASVLTSAPAVSQAADPCDPATFQAIACENTRPGSPSSEWDVDGSGSSAIQGFATDISVDQGERVEFKIDTPATAYRIDIYRLGYYDGLGARRVATVSPSAALPQNQPSCLTEAATGLVDCGNWGVSAAWDVPGDAVSGVYFARPVREDGTEGSSHIVFVVRDDDGGSDLLFQTSDTTWQAYNEYGGNSLYVGQPAGRAYKVSYNRPFTTRDCCAEDWVFNAEYPMIRWLEANGYDVSYTTGVDTDRRGDELLEHDAFVSVGHDEYWSGAQRANVEAARDAGVHLAFLSGNEVFWKTRWEPGIDASGAPYRTLVAYKETLDDAKIDPSDEWTGTWRDPRFSPPADGGRPENGLTGTIFNVNGYRSDPIRVDSREGRLRFWRDTSLASLPSGQTATLPDGLLGYEWDTEEDNGFRPAGLVRLSTTTIDDAPVLQDYGSSYASGTATHNLTLHRAASGALIFGAGTVQWSWGLDDDHDFDISAADPRVRQATVNLFADMGVQPGTIQPGLTAAQESTDATGPTVTVTAPADGTALSPGVPITVTGTASDAGGVVAAVEVSIDGGVTWRPASGFEDFTYTFTPPDGEVTIAARAADDSANLGAPSAPVTVTVGNGTTECCSLFGPAETPDVGVEADAGAVEVGVRVVPSRSGAITALRFYKGGPENSGVHVAHLFDGAGELLASATFTDETTSGWQRVALDPPVRVTGGQTYVASYHAPDGGYATSTGFFSTALDRDPLRAPADGDGGGNGVYAYGPSGGFPTNSWNATNYWVDVEFTDSVAPAVTDVAPGDGAVDVALTASVSATFDTDVDPATATITLRTADGTDVAGQATYDAASRTITLVPDAPLGPETAHVAEVSATDPAGREMDAPVTWGFTTAGADVTAPTVVDQSPTPGQPAVPLDATVSATFDEPVEADSLDVVLRDDAGSPVAADVALDGPRTTATLTPQQPLEASTTYEATVAGASDTAGNALADPVVWTFTTVDADGCPCSIFGPDDLPDTPAEADSSSVELGVRFRTQSDGFVTGLRFYKGSVDNGGTHVGNLWTGDGSLLASATFTDETDTGWQQVSLAEPVPVTADTTYVASYLAPDGNYPVTIDAFAAQGAGSGVVRALADGEDGPNGVYAYGSTGGFPTNSWRSANYFVDVVFAGSVTDLYPPTLAGRTPAADATRVPVDVAVTATFSEDVDPATITASLTAPTGPVDVTTDYDAATRTLTLDGEPLAYDTTYTVTVADATDAAGNVMQSISWSFTTRSEPGTCPCSVWDDSDVPGIASNADGSAVEVGVRLRPAVDGYLTAIRFYKGPDNAGPHEGHLWDTDGTLLGTAVFSDETATGWQQAPLAAPVPVLAGQTVIASYHAPAGGYALDEDFFTSAVDTGSLRALADGEDGPNGVYTYGANASFPTSAFRSSNYWVDVVVAPSAEDTIAPVVTTRSPAADEQRAAVSSNVTATFSEPVTIADATFSLLDATGTPVAASVVHDAASRRLTLDPDDDLAPSSDYTVELSGVADIAGNVMVPVTWAFRTAAPPPQNHLGPGGPIAVIGDPSRPFSRYYAEILRAEGMNSFAALDVADLTPAALADFAVAILGEVPLTAAQATTLQDWVAGGGDLVAMRPDPQLSDLLGLSPDGTTLSDGYLAIDTATAPGAGITAETMQYHGPADGYVASGARTVATLFSDAATATTLPAVTLRDVGGNGGQAAAFTYDLARSVVTTRQGNPEWAATERDGLAPIRSDDLYFGGTENDWVDLDKVAIPQADEQQRLLANLIVEMTRDQAPVPRFWYFPRMERAVVVATGDDHANGGTAGRFIRYDSLSQSGCDVDDWECLRFTSYIYPNTPLSSSDAAAFDQQGFEVAAHITTGCGDYTPQSIDADYAGDLAAFGSIFAGVASPSTNRTHCIVWSDWSTQADVAWQYGIRLDTNYYYFPGPWVQDRPGFMTGSGMPMRFARLDGSMVDVYQAATQLTDESDQSYPFTPDALLDRALGPEGYYGAFTTNMHTDASQIAEDDALVASAVSRGVPVVTARQMLTWLDGRNGSTFDDQSWDGSTLGFTIAVAPGANGLTAMLPADAAAGPLAALRRDGTEVTTTETIVKGVRYVTFDAAPGAYEAQYGDGTAVAAASVPVAAPGLVVGVVGVQTRRRRAGRLAGRGGRR